MSTRSTIYYSDRGNAPHIHIYYEMLDDAPNDVHMEIQFPWVLVDIPLPVDLQEWLGIKRER